MNVTIAGTGYVGLVTGACLSFLGHNVICVDTDLGKIETLRAGAVPIFEPGLEELLALARSRGGLEFSAEIGAPVAGSDVIFIAVGTPPRPGGEADLTALEKVARSIGSAMDDSRFRVVVNKSTVPVGSGNLVDTLVREGIRAAHPGRESLIDFEVASNPEFLREGSAISDSLYPDRIVIGTEDGRAAGVLVELYRSLTNQDFAAPPMLPRPAGRGPVPLVSTSLTSAEMIKYAANAFLAAKIGFANEIANICERTGADARVVMTGIGLDRRIGSGFLNAGIGWGGSCFGKDIRSLLHTAADYGYDARILNATLEVNTQQRQIVIQKLLETLCILRGRTIALLGLAFKPETDDLRDAPSVEIAAKLLEMGTRVRAYDPIAMDACRRQHRELAIAYCDSALDCAAGADAVVLVTEWKEFADLDLTELARRMARPVLIDGRNLFDPQDARRAGFTYAAIGTRSRPLPQRSAFPAA